jgi:NADPH:quinone reductase
MKKIIVEGGGTLAAVDVRPTTLHDDEVEIEVRAASVNFADTKIRFGYYPDTSKKNPDMGQEVSGVVTRTGRDAHIFAVGEPVFAVWHWGGGYAERVIVPEAAVFRKPVFLSFEEAAAFPIVFQTAYHLLHTAVDVKPHASILIHAAGGGVGTALVQLAKQRGVKIIAAASDDTRLEKLIALGATHTVNYAKENLADAVTSLTDKHGVNVIYDGNGGDFFPKNFEMLSMQGTVVLFGNSAGTPAPVEPYRLVYSSLSMIGFSMRAITAKPALYHHAYKEILALLESRKVQVEIGARFPLSDAAKAHDLLLSRKNYGKVVLIP